MYVSMRTSKLNIAIVLDSLSRGGAEKVALAVANNIDRKRYVPIMITTRDSGELAVELDKDIECFSLDRKRRFDVTAIKKLSRLFDDRNIAIVHSHNHSSSYFCRVVRFFCKNKWKHVVHDHHGPAVGSMKIGLLDRVFLNNVDCYITVSDALKERACKTIGIPRSRCEFVRNGVLIPEYASSPKNDKVKIVQVGRIELVKNHMLALRIIRELKINGHYFEWLFAGRSNDRQYYHRLLSFVKKWALEDCVTFLGEQPDIPSLLQQADIGVLTSTQEGLSVAMLEYMASGLPVVITEVGESSNIIRQTTGGYVVPQNDNLQAAEALADLIKNENLRSRLGRHNRQHVKNYYSASAMTETIMDIYDRVLGHA